MDEQQKVVREETNNVLMEDLMRMEDAYWDRQYEMEEVQFAHLLLQAEIHGDIDEEGVEEDQFHQLKQSQK